MPTKIVFATRNAHKIQELMDIFPADMFSISTLDAMGITEEIPENEPTIYANAVYKAEYIYKKLHLNTLADDTGLEVDYLSGAPGVLSARYAGTPANSANNVLKLLENMHGATQRTARFRTVIAAMINDKLYTAEGVLHGTITHAPVGSGGFGYDSVFMPDGYHQTLAEISPELKNTISHRALAVQELGRQLGVLSFEF